VIDKPAGLLALPDGYDPSVPHVKSVLSPEHGPLWIVHRLDRFTSGVMVLARNADAHQQLNTQFQDRKVKKAYRALVLGSPVWDRKLVELPLRINTGRRHRTVVDLSKGKPSATQFTVRERFKDYSLVEAVPETGRRHQIRAHLSNEGYPIACDNLYGNQIEIHRSEIDANFQAGTQPGEPVLKRPGLHASSIEFFHPLEGQIRVFDSPHASDMQLTLNMLQS
jgi:RluA family pseudouridine synthase